MRIIGIDPGLAFTGYGVVDVWPNGDVEHVAHGVIKTSASQELASRLAEIGRDVAEVIATYAPTHAAYEHVVAAQGKGSGASMTIMASGVIVATFGMANLPTAKYPPQAWKAGVVPQGGRAKKDDVQAAMRDDLGLDYLPSPEHAADALAIAVHRGRRLAGAITDAA